MSDVHGSADSGLGRIDVPQVALTKEEAGGLDVVGDDVGRFEQ